MECSERQSATIMRFERPVRRADGVTVSDRITALLWAGQASESGARAVRVFDPEPNDDPAVGAFMLIYCDDAMWATWGIARRRGGYELWRPSFGATAGQFDCLSEALDAISSQPSRRLAIR